MLIIRHWPGLSLFASILRFWTNSLLVPVYLAAVSAVLLVTHLAVKVISHTHGAHYRNVKVPTNGFSADGEETTGFPLWLSRGRSTSFLEASRIASCLVLCGLSVLATIRSRSNANGGSGIGWKLELAQSLYFVSQISTKTIFFHGGVRSSLSYVHPGILDYTDPFILHHCAKTPSSSSLDLSPRGNTSLVHTHCLCVSRCVAFGDLLFGTRGCAPRLDYMVTDSSARLCCSRGSSDSSSHARSCGSFGKGDEHMYIALPPSVQS